MRKLNGYSKARVYSDQEKLPRGGYILKILDVEYKENDWGDTIVLSFDINEGDHKGFYKENYDNQIGEDKKWKGKYRINVPKDDGSEEDEWRQNAFKTIMANFEESNTGFHWDWDEQKLNGRLIGALFNAKEYEFNGHHGFFTNCKRLVTTQKIQSGNYEIPVDDLLQNKKSPVPKTDENGFMNVPDGIDEEIPFN